jgi:hypothetical protein
MKDQAKTKAQLLAEVAALRQQVAEMGSVIATHQQAEKNTRQRTAQLEALRQVSLELTTELKLDTLLESIVLRAVELLEAQTGGIYLYRPEADVLELVVMIGSPSGPRGTILRYGEGVSGQVWAIGQPMIINNYQT